MTTLRVYLKWPWYSTSIQMDNLGLSLKKCSFMVSGKCISHFKMLWSVSRAYYGEVALSSPFFLNDYSGHVQENSGMILNFLRLYLLFFLASWSMGSVGSFWTWNNWPIKGTGLLPWAKRAGLYNQNRYSYWIWIFGPILVQLGPILVQLGPILAHFVTGVGLSNLTVIHYLKWE